MGNKKVGLICDPQSEISVQETQKILTILRADKFEIIADKSLSEFNIETVEIERADVDFIIVVGDDGTILQTFGRMSEKEIPVLGINSGNLGFLAEIEPINFRGYSRRLKEGDFHIEKRERLKVDIDGLKIPACLNEVAIVPNKTATLMRYALNVNQELVWRDGADGVIIATPTGSTGHSMSAGGPITSANSGVFVITPIASINQSVRPLVVSNESEIVVENVHSPVGCEIVVDGYSRIKLDGKNVTVKRAKKDALFIRFEKGKYSQLTGKLKKKIDVYEKDVVDLPPSAKYLFKILQYEKTLTQKEIIEESALPARTVRNALDVLIKKGYIAKKPYLRDIRQELYRIK